MFFLNTDYLFLRPHKDIATVETTPNHLTLIAPECYEALGALAVMNPPIRDRRHYEASWAAIRTPTAMPTMPQMMEASMN